MRLRDHYDWIVIGDHPGALLSAALVARLGLSVLILPALATDGGRSQGLSVSRSGQYRDPESNLLMGLLPSAGKREGGLLGICLAHLGLQPAESERISVAEACPQVVTPATRFTLHADPERLAAEYAREFGAEGDDRGWLTARAQAAPIVRAFWAGYPDRLTLDLAPAPGKGQGSRPGILKKKGLPHARSLDALVAALARLKSTPRSQSGWLAASARSSDVARGLVRSEPGDLPEIVAGLHAGAAGNPDPDPRALDFLHAISSSETTGRFRGGLTAYRDLLLRIAKRLGASVPEGVDCRRVFVEAGRIVGVQASHHGNMIACTGLAAGCSREALQAVMTTGSRSFFRNLKSAPPPAGWAFTLALTVHEEAIPPGLGSRTIWKERAAPALEIEIVNPADYGLTERESRFIFLRTALPFRAETLDPAYQRLVAARMFRQLTELLPFVEFHVRRVFPDFRPDPATAELVEAHPFTKLSEIPENLRVHFGEGAGSRSGLEGLFVVSGESFPRYGSLGGTVAALEASAWIAHRCGLAGPILNATTPREPEVHA